jgi:hypothetical protein
MRALASTRNTDSEKEYILSSGTHEYLLMVCQPGVEKIYNNPGITLTVRIFEMFPGLVKGFLRGCVYDSFLIGYELCKLRFNYTSDLIDKGLAISFVIFRKNLAYVHFHVFVDMPHTE